jgi:hypothetical protein
MATPTVPTTPSTTLQSREPCHFERKSSYLEAIGPDEGRIPIEHIQSILQKGHSLTKARQERCRVPLLGRLSQGDQIPRLLGCVAFAGQTAENYPHRIPSSGGAWRQNKSVVAPVVVGPEVP